eukprot:172979_1
MGIDTYLTNSGTICDSEQVDSFAIKRCACPVIKVAVDVINSKHLKHLVQGLQKLSKCDQMVNVSIDKQGQHIIGGINQLHIDTCVRMLQDFMLYCPIKTTDYKVPFRESIDGCSGSTNDNSTK